MADGPEQGRPKDPPLMNLRCGTQPHYAAAGSSQPIPEHPQLLRGSSAPHPPTAPCPDTLRGDGVWVAAPGAEGHGQFQRHVSWLCGSQIHRPSSFHHGVFLTKLYNT